jgi:hypothetical protein
MGRLLKQFYFVDIEQDYGGRDICILSFRFDSDNEWIFRATRVKFCADLADKHVRNLCVCVCSLYSNR